MIITSRISDLHMLKIKQEISAIISTGKSAVVEVKEHRQKRSLDANSYAWVLIGKLADALRLSKNEVYLMMLADHGQREHDQIKVVAEAAETVYRATDGHVVEIGRCEENGVEYIHLAFLIGSSRYTSKEMAIFIDGIIEECRLQGIETMTPDELQVLYQRMEEKK